MFLLRGHFMRESELEPGANDAGCLYVLRLPCNGSWPGHRGHVLQRQDQGPPSLNLRRAATFDFRFLLLS